MPSQDTEQRKLPPWAVDILKTDPRFKYSTAYELQDRTLERLIQFVDSAHAKGHEPDKTTLEEVAALITNGGTELDRRAAAIKVVLRAATPPDLSEHTSQEVLLHPVRGSELWMETLEPPSMLIDELWQKNGCGFFGGDPKKLKTYTLFEFAIALVTGRKVFDRFVVNEAGPVLVFLEETQRNEAQQRMYEVCRGKGLGRDNVADLHLMVQDQILLTDPRYQDAIRAQCQRVKPKLCVFDHLGRMAPNAQYKAEFVEPVLTYLRRLQVDHSTAVILVDHLNRPDPENRRSTVSRLPGTQKYGWFDSALFFSGPEDREVVQVEGKHRNAPAPHPFTIRRREKETPDGKAVELVYEPGRLLPENIQRIARELLQAIQEAADSGLTTRDLRATGTGQAKQKDAAVAYLLESGQIVQADGHKTGKNKRRYPATRHYLPEHAPEKS